MLYVNIPNLITLARIVAVPVVVWLIINAHLSAAFWLFIIAGISDGVDGFIAKRFAQRTVLGAYLDPIADKALLVSIYVALGLQSHIPNWLVILVVSRDILIIGAVILSWIMEHAVTMHPLYISKITTAGQIALAAFVLADLSYGLQLVDMRFVLIVAVAGFTILSGLAYLVNWLKHMATYEEL